MKMVKSLLLGSAAGLAALTGAQAADLPVKAKPVEYVKICSLYGAGFYYIPGTDTCIRIGGHIRAEVNFNARGTNLQSFGVGDGNATSTRDRDIFFTRSRVFTNVDTRTQTSFGTLRTFSVVRAEVNTPVGNVGAAGIVAIDSGIIQWGGFTIGRAGTSYFDNPWAYAYKWGANGWLGNPDTAGGRFVAAYTHQFGNGISGTLSLEDNKERKRGNYNAFGGTFVVPPGATAAVPGTVVSSAAFQNLLALPGVNPPGTDVRGGNTWPEIVGQLRIDQAWGGFHLSGSIVNNHVAYNCGASANSGFAVSGTSGAIVPTPGCNEVSGHPTDKLGGAVNAGFKFNVPTGVNDALYIAGAYSKGNTTNVFANIGQGSAFGIYGGSSSAPAGFYGSLAYGHVFDSVYNSAATTAANPTGAAIGPTGQQLTTAYGGSIAFEHGWNAEWRTSVFGGAQVLDYNATANALLCWRQSGVQASFGTLSNATTTCNNDYRVIGAGTRTYWTPVRDLTIGMEFMWTQHHSGNEGATLTNPGGQLVNNNFKPQDVSYLIKDQNVFSGIFSVRRFF